MREVIIGVVCSVIALIAGALIGWICGIAYRKRVAEAEMGSAEEKAKAIVEDAQKQAETMKKEALIEAKEEIIRQRNETERDLKERRAEKRASSYPEGRKYRQKDRTA